MKLLDLNTMEKFEAGACPEKGNGFMIGATLAGGLFGGPVGFVVGGFVGLIGGTFISIASPDCNQASQVENNYLSPTNIERI